MPLTLSVYPKALIQRIWGLLVGTLGRKWVPFLQAVSVIGTWGRQVWQISHCIGSNPSAARQGRLQGCRVCMELTIPLTSSRTFRNKASREATQQYFFLKHKRNPLFEHKPWKDHLFIHKWVTCQGHRASVLKWRRTWTWESYRPVLPLTSWRP